MLADVRTRVRARATWRRRHSALSAAAAELVALRSQSPPASSVSARRRYVVIATSRRSRDPSGSRRSCVNDRVSVTRAVVRVLLPRIVLRHLLRCFIVSLVSLAVTRPHRFPSLRHRHRDSTCRPPACRLRRDTAHNPCASCSASQPAAHHSRCVVAPLPLHHRSWFVLWPTARTRSHVVAIAYASSRTLRRSSSSSFIGCTSLLV